MNRAVMTVFESNVFAVNSTFSAAGAKAPLAITPAPMRIPAAIPAPATLIHRLGLPSTTGCGAVPDPDNAPSANATSRAVWKRSTGFFSRQ